jgi:ribokinase
MMGEDRFDVFGFGQCALDYICVVEAFPPPGVKCELSDLAIEGGGPVATALVALARWGVSCTFAGVVGDDGFGAAIRESLDQEGIDTRGLLLRKNAGSQSAFILAEPGVGRRTIFWHRPSGAPPRPDELDHGLIAKARVLHTDGLFTETAIVAAECARRAGVEVVVDAGSLRPGMLELARLSDHFLASETFARALVGGEGPVAACHELAALGPRVVGHHRVRRRVSRRLHLRSDAGVGLGEKPRSGRLGCRAGLPRARRPSGHTSVDRG